MWKFHRWFERNSLILIIAIVIAISIGGIIEITPLFYLESTIERCKAVPPTPRSNWKGVISTSQRAALAAIRR